MEAEIEAVSWGPTENLGGCADQQQIDVDGGVDASQKNIKLTYDEYKRISNMLVYYSAGKIQKTHVISREITWAHVKTFTFFLNKKILKYIRFDANFPYFYFNKWKSSTRATK